MPQALSSHSPSRLFLMLFLSHGCLDPDIFRRDHSETFQKIEMSCLHYKNNPSQNLRLRSKWLSPPASNISQVLMMCCSASPPLCSKKPETLNVRAEGHGKSRRKTKEQGGVGASEFLCNHFKGSINEAFLHYFWTTSIIIANRLIIIGFCM